jgi:hypothetical protein
VELPAGSALLSRIMGADVRLDPGRFEIGIRPSWEEAQIIDNRRYSGRGMPPGRPRLILVALLLIGLAMATAGCAFEGQIGVQLVGGAPVVVTQSSQAELTPHRVQGTTTRAKQVVKIDCSVTGVFDVREATGSAVLIQLYVVHLRTRPLPRGTPYQLDCAGPVIMQLPIEASNVQATATSASTGQVPLSVQAPITSAPLAFGKRLRARPGTQLAIVSSSAPSLGSYTLALTLSLPDARAFREKVLYTASIACGRSKYVQPIRPLVTSMTRVPALTVQPSSNLTSLSVPHLFGGIRSYGEATRRLSCAR